MMWAFLLFLLVRARTKELEDRIARLELILEAHGIYP